MKRFDIRAALLAAAVGLIPVFAAAQTSGAAGSTTTSGTTTAPATAAKPTARLAGEFSELAGSTENATALVNGLRSGGAITLSGSGGTTSSGAGSVTFTSPTKPMGYGNIRIALSLARTQLASQGITNSTPEQLQGALMGTTTGGSGGTTTQGILQMRALGMGWGQIANSMGFKLGAVMSGKQPVGATAGTSTTTASGGASRGGASASVTTGAGGGGKHSGITTAGGHSGNAGASSGYGHGQAASSGAVSAAGARAGGVGGGTGGGRGMGGGKP